MNQCLGRVRGAPVAHLATPSSYLRDTPAATESELRDSPDDVHLSPLATPRANYLVTIRSRKPRFGRTRTSDMVRSHEAPTAMGRTDESDFKKPSASRVGNKDLRNLHQESKWTNPGMLHRSKVLVSLYTFYSLCIKLLLNHIYESIFANRFHFIY